MCGKAVPHIDSFACPSRPRRRLPQSQQCHSSREPIPRSLLSNVLQSIDTHTHRRSESSPPPTWTLFNNSTTVKKKKKAPQTKSAPRPSCQPILPSSHADRVRRHPRRTWLCRTGRTRPCPLSFTCRRLAQLHDTKEGIDEQDAICTRRDKNKTTPSGSMRCNSPQVTFCLPSAT